VIFPLATNTNDTMEKSSRPQQQIVPDQISIVTKVEQQKGEENKESK
jgi:hypothetical protein